MAPLRDRGTYGWCTCPVTQYGRDHDKIDGITYLALFVVGVALTIGFAFTIYGMAACVFALFCLMAGVERLSR